MRAFQFFTILSISLITRITAQTCSQGVCRKCDIGQWSSGRAGCSNCTSDTIRTCNPNNGFATDCFPGNGFDSSSGTCTPSPIGSWSNGHNLSSLCISTSIQSCSGTTGVITACNAGYGYSNITTTCQACITGTASPPKTMLPCSSCSPGSYSTTLASNCTLCDLDFYSTKVGASSCIACAIGQTAARGSINCTTCVIGTYKSTINTCSNCLSPGVLSCGPGSNAANSCLLGYGLVNGTCNPCDGGSFSPQGAILPCSACPAGKFASSNAGVCTSCPLDTYSTNSSSTICSPCDPGKISAIESTFCTTCANGTYHSGLNKCLTCMGTGIASCGPIVNRANTCRAGYGFLIGGMCGACFSGTASPEGSSLPCWSCAPGQFSGNLAANCTSCPPNYFSSTFGTTLCTPCNPGSISPSGSSSCSTCAAGLFVNGLNSCGTCSGLSLGVETCGPVSDTANTCNAGYGLASGSCNPCNGGSYSAQGSTLSCLTCPPGAYSTSLSSNCTQCARNTFAVNSGSSICSNCPAGSIAIGGSTSCTFCKAGTYEDNMGVCYNCLDTGVASCGPQFKTAITCSAGYGLVNEVCTACIGGFYALEGNSLLCSSCPPGQYSSTLSSFCSPCPPDHFSDNWNTTTCSACPDGTIAPVGASICKVCPTNTYQDGINSCASCLGNGTLGILSCGPVNDSANTCVAGYGLVDGDCVACLGGFYSPSGAIAECLTCKAGQYSVPISSMCLGCPSNSFSDTSGSSSCSPCPQGKISPVGASSCSSCGSGTYQSGLNTCSNCMQVGTASCGPTTNTSNTCLAGYGLVSGQCVACLGGFASRNGSTAECLTCPPGSSSPPLSSTCFPCPANYFALNAGTAACSTCAAGMISPIGATSCSSCSSGLYQSGGNSCSSCMGNSTSGIMSCGPALNTANTCLAGYGLIRGSCISCKAGFANKAGATVECLTCNPGQYSNPLAAGCTSCALDTFTADFGTAACTACDLGMIAPVGSTSCSMCGTGLYKSDVYTCSSCMGTGISTCGPLYNLATSCNIGYGLVSGVCKMCTPGTAAPAGAVIACQTCPSGYFAGSNAGICTKCPLDSFASNPGSSTCTACDPGRVAKLGSSVCTTCPLSTYRSAINTCVNCMSTGFATCGPINIAANSCIIGYGLVNGGCNICVGGTASPAGATASCYQCSAGLFAPPNAGVCTSCPADTFAIKPGTTNCSPCDAGNISEMGSTTCHLCPVGTYHSGLNTCSNCLGTGISTCGPVVWAANTCLLGFGLVSGACIACIGGWASPGGTAICSICSSGNYASARSATCLQCSPDYYAEFPGTTICQACTPGWIANAGSNTCTMCQAGTWRSGINTCTSCITAGVASCGPVLRDAKSCLAGYQLQNGACNSCSVGSWSPGGTVQCSNCLNSITSSCSPTTGSATGCVANYAVHNSMPTICTSLIWDACPDTGPTSWPATYYAGTSATWGNCIAACERNPACMSMLWTGLRSSANPQGNCYASNTIPSMGVWQYQITVTQRSNPSVARAGITASCFTCTTSTCGNCPDHKWYGTDASLSCKDCPDKYSITCDPATGASVTCVQYYAAISGICQPQIFARYVAYDSVYQDIQSYGSIATEVACYVVCQQNNAMNGPYQTFTYIHTGQACYCKTGAVTAKPTWLAINSRVTSLVGSCATYRGILEGTCQDVIWTSSGCIGVDSTACFANST